MCFWTNQNSERHVFPKGTLNALVWGKTQTKENHWRIQGETGKNWSQTLQ